MGRVVVRVMGRNVVDGVGELRECKGRDGVERRGVYVGVLGRREDILLGECHIERLSILKIFMRCECGM